MKYRIKQNSNEYLTYFNTNEKVEIPEQFNLKSLRAFWVSNVVNIDLPNMEDSEFKNKVLKMLDTAVEFNINTIFFQVRPLNDAYYESKLNPYSRFLTGKEGKKPEYDVFKFVIDEAKKRQIDIHAWCNPYRVSMKLENMSKDEYLSTLDDMNFAKKNPGLVITDKNNQLILNPTKEEVKLFVIESMLEILDNYDVAGIHFDDYFYPYAGLSEHDNDLKDFENRIDKSMSLDDFRRYHITDIVKRLHKIIKEKYPNKQFGISPFGIWQNSSSTPLGSNTDPKCSQSYDNQYADTYLWVKEGYIDYIVPQLYWDFEHPLAPFADLVKWWANVVKDTNVKLYIGHGPYRIGSEGGYSNVEEVADQLKFANQFDEVSGNVFFTYKTFIDESKKTSMDLVKTLLNEGKKII